MNVKELYDHLHKIIKISQRFGEYTVVVEDHRPSIGPKRVVNVKDCHQGIDWNHGKLFIVTDKPMVVKEVEG